MNINKFLFLFVGILLVMSTSAQHKNDFLAFKDRLQPISEDNVFRSKEYFNWCSSIIKGDDGKYHLFYSRWPRKYTFLSWLTHSEVAHAVSNSPAGPFKILDKPVIDYMDTEDMSLWYDTERDYYYGVFHAHTFIGMVSSPDGINWDKANEFVLHQNELNFADGTTVIPDRLERPFVFTEDGEPKVMSLAVKKDDESYIVFIPVKEQTLPVNPELEQE